MTLTINRTKSRVVSYEELLMIEAPKPTKTWFPIKHSTVFDTVTEILTQRNYEIKKTQLAVSRNGQRMFGCLDLSRELVDGEVGLSVGIRNSVDKSLPLGFVAGSRVFVCDNLAFCSDLIVKFKHTLNGEYRFLDEIMTAVDRLPGFINEESRNIRDLKNTEIGEEQVSHIMLSAYRQDIIPARLFPSLVHEVDRNDPRTCWQLYNNFTSVMRDMQVTNSERFVQKTMLLNNLFAPISA
jgi:hypothetical protein